MQSKIEFGIEIEIEIEIKEIRYIYVVLDYVLRYNNS